MAKKGETMRKKISKKDVDFILNYKKRHLKNYLINWELAENESGFVLKGKWKTIVKILLTIPAFLLVIICCMWDEGIKYIPFEMKHLWEISDIYECRNYYNTDNRYNRMKKVWESR